MGIYNTAVEKKHRAFNAQWSKARMERALRAHLAILRTTGHFAVAPDEREEFGFELLLCAFVDDFIMNPAHDYDTLLDDAFYALMDRQTSAEACAWNAWEDSVTR